MFIVRYATMTALLLLFLMVGNAQAVMIGAWDIKSAPTSASMLSGTFSGEYFISFYNLWLGVDYVPGGVDVNTALSGPNILDDGIANVTVAEAALFELSFAGGSALNRVGTDLVVFDANFDSIGSYGISTSFDNFSTEFILGADKFIDTGEIRTYLLAPKAGYTRAIFGAPIDLTLIGVPDGVSVSQLRVRSVASNDNDADLIGVGSLTAIPEPASVFLLIVGLFLLKKRS